MDRTILVNRVSVCCCLREIYPSTLLSGCYSVTSLIAGQVEKRVAPDRHAKVWPAMPSAAQYDARVAADMYFRRQACLARQICRVNCPGTMRN